MLNDKTIDASKAKYYCAFADKDLEAQLAKATSYTKSDGKRLGKIVQDIAKAKTDESLNEVDLNFAQAAHQAAFPLATGNPFQPNFRALDPSSGVPSLEDQGKNNIIAGATAAALAGVSFIPGGWAALGGAVTGALGSLAGTAVTTVASLGTAGIAAIVGGLVTVSSYLYPRIAKWLKNLSRNNYVAECRFTSNKTPYKCFFSLDECKWILAYDNNRWIRPGTKVPVADVQSFFETAFFSKFSSRCQQHLSVIFDSKKNKDALRTLADMSDKASRKQLNAFLDAEQDIRENMFNGRYVTEADSVNEDAIVSGVSDSADIAAPSASVDSDVVDKGIGSEDVLGKDCDHHKDGYMSTKCFHIPSNVLAPKKAKKKLKKSSNLLKRATITGKFS